jgi:hypothetical protein
MSRVNVGGAVRSIKRQSTAYVPIIEAISNSIDAINKTGREDGKIDIFLEFENVISEMKEPEIISVTVKDNGVGFTTENRESFDTLYSTQKNDTGGKGFGRIFYLKHFDRIEISSMYRENGVLNNRSFTLGRKDDLIENEHIEESSADDTGTEVKLIGLRAKVSGFQANDIEAFSHRVIEKILSYFVSENQKCPTIVIHDTDNESEVSLNDRIGDGEDKLIQVIDTGDFSLSDEHFVYKAFKILQPRNQKSAICLVAHNQEVTRVSLDEYVPEFTSEFYDQKDNNYIVSFYVQGSYLDDNVTGERDGFNFSKEPDLYHTIGRTQIERTVANIAKESFKDEVTTRLSKKKADIEKYAKRNIWYMPYLDGIDYATIKMNLSDSEIESTLHAVKHKQDLARRNEVDNLLKNLDKSGFPSDEFNTLASKISDTDKSNLAQYLAFRQIVLKLFDRAMGWDTNKIYEKEKKLHSLIFPLNEESDRISYDEHNLWIIDERLNFTQHINSDTRSFTKSQDRPDLAAFHYPVSYREGEEAYSPVSVFEFKRPGRYDFINESSKDDPIEQIVRYVNQMRDGNLKTLAGKDINVSPMTPFFGYVVASANSDVKKWLADVKDMKMMPDGEGWFINKDNINLRIEYITWDELLKDAEMRHRVFFEKLGIQ